MEILIAIVTIILLAILGQKAIEQDRHDHKDQLIENNLDRLESSGFQKESSQSDEPHLYHEYYSIECENEENVHIEVSCTWDSIAEEWIQGSQGITRVDVVINGNYANMPQIKTYDQLITLAKLLGAEVIPTTPNYLEVIFNQV